MFDDDRRWPEVPIEDEPERPEEPDELELPGEDPREDLPDDFEDVPEPLDGDDESSLGGSTDPRAARNRQSGLSKDEYEADEGSPTERKQ